MTSPTGADVWRALSTTPLVGLTSTLVVYAAAVRVQRHCRNHPLAHPVLLSALVLVAGLVATRLPYASWFSGAQFLHFLLGPATVALAVPLHEQVHRVRRAWPAVLIAVLAGALAAVGSVFLSLRWLGGSALTMRSLAPKSVTTPIAMGIADKIGGDSQLTVLAVAVTGILGAMIGGSIFKLVGIQDWRAIGLGMGVASHGIGTARAVELDEVAGAFAGLAMGLTALVTALLLPLCMRWFDGAVP